MKLVWVLILIYGLGGALAFADVVDSSTKNQIQIKDYVVFDGEAIHFSDLIEGNRTLKGGDPIVFKIPSNSNSLRVTKESALEKIKSVGLKESLQLPSAIHFERRGWNSSIELTKRKLKSQIESLCGACEAEVVSLQAAQPSNLNGTMVFEAAKISQVPKGSITLDAEVRTIEGTRVSSIWVNAVIKVWATVPVAKKMLVQGWRLQTDDFELKKVDITMLTDIGVEPDKLIGKKISRSLTPNQPILTSYLERERDITYGQPVKLILRKETWQVSLDGIARESGSVGDEVKVYNPSTKKVLAGRIIEKGIVELQ